MLRDDLDLNEQWQVIVAVSEDYDPCVNQDRPTATKTTGATPVGAYTGDNCASNSIHLTLKDVSVT